MELKHLEYFVTCARAGSFTKAADLLYINQSSISRAIQALEEEWNITLFLRSRRGAFLTVEGQEYYQKAEQILSEIKALSGTSSLINHRYYTFASFPSNFISNVFAQFCMEHKEDPTIFRLLSRSTSEILRLLSEHLVDIGFIYSSKAQYGKLSRILQRENLSYVPLCYAAPCIYIGELANRAHEGTWTIHELKQQKFFKVNYDFKESYHDLANTIEAYGLTEILAKAPVVDDGYGIYQMLNFSDFCYLGHIWMDKNKEHEITNKMNQLIFGKRIVLDSLDGEITVGYVYRTDDAPSLCIKEFLNMIPFFLEGDFFKIP